MISGHARTRGRPRARRAGRTGRHHTILRNGGSRSWSSAVVARHARHRVEWLPGDERSGPAGPCRYTQVQHRPQPRQPGVDARAQDRTQDCAELQPPGRGWPTDGNTRAGGARTNGGSATSSVPRSSVARRRPVAQRRRDPRGLCGRRTTCPRNGGSRPNKLERLGDVRFDRRTATGERRRFRVRHRVLRLVLFFAGISLRFAWAADAAADPRPGHRAVGVRRGPGGVATDALTRSSGQERAQRGRASRAPRKNPKIGGMANVIPRNTSTVASAGAAGIPKAVSPPVSAASCTPIPPGTGATFPSMPAPTCTTTSCA